MDVEGVSCANCGAAIDESPGTAPEDRKPARRRRLSGCARGKGNERHSARATGYEARPSPKLMPRVLRYRTDERCDLFDRDAVEHLDGCRGVPADCADRSCCGSTSTATPSSAPTEVAEAFDLDDTTREYLATPHERPVFDDHGRYIHITTYAPREDEEGELHAVECVVGENWVITAHDQPIPVLEEFAERVSGSGDTGSLDGPGFLAALLEWVLGSYTAAFERIEQRLEEFDAHAMRGEGTDEDIETLIEMRRQVGVLRRALAAHRSALVALDPSRARGARQQRLRRTIPVTLHPLRGDPARGSRRARGDRRLLRRPDRPRTATRRTGS